MPYAHDEVKLKHWENGVARGVAIHRQRWDQYDDTIRAALAVYTRHLERTNGWLTIDWRMVKALVWTESGGENPAWPLAPMQCGVNGDPGLGSFLNQSAGKLILPPEFANKFTVGNVPRSALLNIQAGTGFLLMRLARFDARGLIIGWRLLTPVLAAQRYNGGGDANYPEKMQFCYDLITGAINP